jgi:hypothetical protein
MSLQVQIVQASSQSLWDALLTGGTGNLALLADEYIKGAKPVRSFDETLWYLGSLSANNGKQRIGRLTINGHGNETGFRIGEDWISLKTMPQFKRQIDHLRVLMERNGVIEVVACNVGSARALLTKFSGALGGVNVIGFMNEQPGGFPPEGPRVLANPHGTWSPAAPAAGVTPPSPPPPRR